MSAGHGEDTSCDVRSLTLAGDDGARVDRESGSMRRHLMPSVAAVVLLASVALTASGCAVVDGLVHKQKSAEYADADAFVADGDLDAPWLPVDSTQIRVIRSTQADDAALAAESSIELDPALCTEVPRQSAPAYTLDDAVDVYDLDTVFACGDWAVAKTPDGWLGWTPNHPDEAAQSPTS